MFRKDFISIVLLALASGAHALASTAALPERPMSRRHPLKAFHDKHGHFDRMKGKAGSIRLPLNSGAVVVDTGLLVALDRVLGALRADKTPEPAFVHRANQLIFRDKHIRITETTAEELGHFNEFQLYGIVRTKKTSHPEYQSLLRKLERFKVGRAEGVNDRNIVADVFFAKTEDESTPTLVTADSGIFLKLYENSEVPNPTPKGSRNFEQFVREHYPDGFPVVIEDRKILVIPIFEL